MFRVPLVLAQLTMPTDPANYDFRLVQHLRPSEPAETRYNLVDERNSNGSPSATRKSDSCSCMAAFFGAPRSFGHLTLGILAVSFGLALLFPVLPYALEMRALRQMTPMGMVKESTPKPAKWSLIR